ncbi:MAG TPA: endonuclease/exonuclease/phosphatase family protein, partial [Tichowtungia sp.]|nr:endonuclease/exonuclease/phosphatase family protein [Tichowtungia sp.]
MCWILLAGLAAATLLGFFGRFFWLFDLFAHFRVQYFQFALILVGIAIWKHNNRLLAVAAAIACLNYAFVLPLYFGKPPPATEEPARAMLMNVLASNGNTQPVLEAIEKADPDLLLLLEVTPEWAKELATLEYPYRVADVRDDCFGIMLLSRYPLSNTNVIYPGTAGIPTVTANVHLPQGEISVIGTHPLPPLGPGYSRHRNLQLMELPYLVMEQKKPVFLIGDLNCSPWSYWFRRILSESGLKNSMQGFGFQPSWPADNRLLRIPI